MDSASYEERSAAFAQRDRWRHLWNRGADLQGAGGLCFVAALAVAVVGGLQMPETRYAFGARITGHQMTLMWAGTLGGLLAVGYGLTFRTQWGVDMTVTTIGFLSVSHVMNEISRGVTVAGLGVLFGLGLVGVYLICRSDRLVSVRVPARERTPWRGRRR